MYLFLGIVHNLEEEEHQLTLSISVNQLVGFTFELILSLWSTYIAWQGVRAEEFTSLRRDGGLPDQIIPVSVTNRTQQMPVSAIYQLLQVSSSRWFVKLILCIKR